MKARISAIIATCCLASVAFAADTGTSPQPTTSTVGTGATVPANTPPLLSGNLTTLSGKTFIAVALKRVDPDGLLIFHKGGEAKVLLTDLPESVRLKYYDAQKVAAFQAAQAAEAERQAKERAAEEERQAEQRAAAAEKQAEKLKAKEQFRREVRIQGIVIQVVKEGMIVRVAPWDETPLKGRPPVMTGGPEWVFVVGHRGQDSKVDGDRVQVDALRDGMFSYTTTTGVEKRLAKYQVVHRTP